MCQLVWGAVTLHRVKGTNRFQYANYPSWIFYKSINHLWLNIQSYHCDVRSACQSNNTAIYYTAFLGHHENEGRSWYALKCRCTFFFFNSVVVAASHCGGVCLQHRTVKSPSSQWNDVTAPVEPKVRKRHRSGAFSACFKNGACRQTPCCGPSHSQKRGRRNDERVFIFCWWIYFEQCMCLYEREISIIFIKKNAIRFCPPSWMFIVAQCICLILFALIQDFILFFSFSLLPLKSPLCIPELCMLSVKIAYQLLIMLKPMSPYYYYFFFVVFLILCKMQSFIFYVRFEETKQ